MSEQTKVQYQVQTDTWEYEVHDNLASAEKQFEWVKDSKMGEGVNEDSYVELVMSDDDFEDHTVLKRVVAVIDHERTELRSPKEEGYPEWDYWAKWQEYDVEDSTE